MEQEARSPSAPSTRRSPAAMDCGQGTSVDQAPLAPLPPATVAQPRRSTPTNSAPGLPAPQPAIRLLDDASSEPQRRPWVDLPSDILGVVVGRLALVEDRGRLRSVCRAWRAASRLHRLPPPPLPLLVLSDFFFSSFNAEGTLTGARRRVPLPETETTTAAGSVVQCVGSIDGWLVAVERDDDSGDLRCFLTNAFSQEIIFLPSPCSANHSVDQYTKTKSLPIINGDSSGVLMNCTMNAAECEVMSFCKVVLSSSPDEPGSVVAAISMAKDTTKLALWRPGMESWCVCSGGCVGKFIDVIFCQGKLYMLNSSEFTTHLFYLHLSAAAADPTGLMVSRVESREIEWPEVKEGYHQNWSIAEWRGKLIVVATYTDDADVWQRIAEVRVVEADLNEDDPVRFTEIKSLDGDSIFISPCSSKSFSSCHYDDGVEADCVHFIDGYLAPEKNAHPFYKFVYNMRDGTMTPFAGEIPRDKLRAPDGMLLNPTWFFPPE